MNPLFQRTGSVRPGRSVFDLSYDKKFDCDMGPIYVVCADEMLPGDVWDISAEVVVRAMPMSTPPLHQVDVKMHYFFVPNRLLFDDWEIFITGDKDGNDTTTLPTWNPSAAAKRNAGTLWDFIYGVCGVTPPAADLPSDLPRRAYMLIYNEYWRDEMLSQEIDWSQTPGTDQDVDGAALTGAGDEDLQIAAWEKDYFTAARPDISLGDAPALPVVITGDGGAVSVYHSTDATVTNLLGTVTSGTIYANNAPSSTGQIRWSDPGLDAATFNAADFRLAFQIQRWQERNARAGVRYEEFIKAHWGVELGDGRASIPEYVGGAQQPIIISEVLGTNQDNTVNPQGQLGGHGISAGRNYIGKWRAREYGIMMGLMTIRPKPTYDQGIQRQWSRTTRYDYYTPEFANLSEQPILEKELYVSTNTTNNNTVFGYTGAWDEYRVKHAMLAGQLHTETAGPGGGTAGTMADWHFGQSYSSRPSFNQEFIECVPRDDAFAAPGSSQWVVNYANRIRAIRPMPSISEPGRLDH